MPPRIAPLARQAAQRPNLGQSRTAIHVFGTVGNAGAVAITKRAQENGTALRQAALALGTVTAASNGETQAARVPTVK